MHVRFTPSGAEEPAPHIGSVAEPLSMLCMEVDSEKLAPEGDVGLISVDRVLARLERMRVAEEAGGDVNVALRDLTSNVEAELASLLGEPTRPFERDALAYMRDHEPTQPILEDIKNIFEKGQTEGWFKDPQDAVMAKRIFELMSGPEFDKAFAREIGDWAEWIELHAKEYPNLDTATQAYFEKWAKTEGYGLYTVQGSLTPEQFARGFKSPDGKINIIGRDLGFQNTPMTTTDRTSGHQQLIHFFETAALVRLDKPATTRLFDSMGEFRYNGRLQYKLGPTNDSSATVWGVLFDAFNTGAPFTPEATSPAIQNVYVKLIPKFYR